MPSGALLVKFLMCVPGVYLLAERDATQVIGLAAVSAVAATLIRRRVDTFFFFSSRRGHTRFDCDWSSDVCSSDLDRARGSPAARGTPVPAAPGATAAARRAPRWRQRPSAQPDAAAATRAAGA